MPLLVIGGDSNPAAYSGSFFLSNPFAQADEDEEGINFLHGNILTPISPFAVVQDVGAS